ncbi:hypothetical protein [Microseira sp. BLCC-F43]|uniref:hypothetical protein n=1 Tax=Microseira sp. BLCC-F43 TaxID=3153602 RepID=UPI0035B87206
MCFTGQGYEQGCIRIDRSLGEAERCVIPAIGSAGRWDKRVKHSGKSGDESVGSDRIRRRN